MLRIVVGALVLAATLAGGAQAQARVARIGIITHNASVESAAPYLDAFRKQLRALGYVEGRNIAVDVRYPAAGANGYRDAAAELIALKPDVLVAANTGATRGAKHHTSTIPIVMVSVGSAVTSGFAETLSRPGGNITGQSFLGRELNTKAVELLAEALPRDRIVAMLYDPDLVPERVNYQPIIDAGRAKGVTVVPVIVRKSEDVAAALASLPGPRPRALHAMTVNITEQPRIAEFGLKQRLPTICVVRECIDAGALMSYGPDFPEFWRGAANYVDKILKGAKPGDLPVEQPTAFEFVISLKTAKALGITIPAPLRARATQLVQ